MHLLRQGRSVRLLISFPMYYLLNAPLDTNSVHRLPETFLLAAIGPIVFKSTVNQGVWDDMISFALQELNPGKSGFVKQPLEERPTEITFS